MKYSSWPKGSKASLLPKHNLMSIIWPKFRLSNTKTDSKKLTNELNVNAEYQKALRTKSYVDFVTKAQLLVNPSSTSPSSDNFLLEPDQQTVPTILETSILAKTPKLKHLLLNYFDVTAKASKICTHILENVNQIDLLIPRGLDAINDHTQIISFFIQNNPFSSPYTQDFEQTHNKYALLLKHLKTKRKMLARKIRLIKCINKATGIFITTMCTFIAMSAIVIALHTVTPLLMGPAILSFPLKYLRTKLLLSFRLMTSENILTKVKRQIDVAAKGVYILDRDFDTMSRLVSRIHDEIEQNKGLVRLFMQRKLSLQVVREINKCAVGFRKKIEELEEHVCLCLVTINRARALIIKEITTAQM